MHYVDLILVAILAFAAFNGYKKGFIHQLASLGAIVLGIYVAIKLSKAMSPWIQQRFTTTENGAKITAFIIIFVLVVIAVHIVANMLEKTFEQAELGFINKIAGVAFGLLKVLFILSALMIFLEFTSIHVSWPTEKDKTDSYLYRPIESFAPALFPYLKIFNNRNKEGAQPANVSPKNTTP